MDLQIIGSGGWPAPLAAALLALPGLFIAFSRRAGWRGKFAWTLATLLPLLFIPLYLWVWQERYPDPGAAPPVEEALGWWTFAFPWGVYLLFRATRHRFSGEASKPKAP